MGDPTLVDRRCRHGSVCCTGWERDPLSLATPATAWCCLLAQSPTLQDIEAQYGPALEPHARAGPCPAASGWGLLSEVQRKCAQWPLTRVFLVQSSEFIYIIYFDAEPRMRDFTLIEN